MVKKFSMAGVVGLALLLGACGGNGGPGGPGGSEVRNSAGQQVDPQTGVPLPGAPNITGGY